MGEWVRTINCEKVIVPCPAIVSAEVSRKAKESLLAKKKASRAISSPINNALSGIFYDYDSGWEIFQYRTQSTGEKIFRLRYPKPDELDYPKMLISYVDLNYWRFNLIKRGSPKIELPDFFGFVIAYRHARLLDEA